MIPVLIMTCGRDRDLAEVAAMAALAAGARSVTLMVDPNDPLETEIVGRGIETMTGYSNRHGNLNGPEIIAEILRDMRYLAIASKTGVCLKLDSDTVLLDINRYASAPYGRNRDETGAFFGAAYSLDLTSINKGIAECQSVKIQPSAPEDLTIWELTGKTVCPDSVFALAPYEVWDQYPCRPDAVSCGNPLPDGSRRDPAEILDRMQSILTKTNHAN